MKYLSFFKTVVFLFFFCYSINSDAAEKRDTVRVLFVGNSYVYYNNLAQMIGLITDSMDTKIICKKSTAGGVTLGEHWNGLKGLKSRQLIEKTRHNIVVIQDNSMWPIQHPDSLMLYGTLFCNAITSAGSRPFIYNTWARQKTPETQPQITAAYSKLAADNHATLVPVGDSWALARRLKPDIDLFNADGSHPSNLGTFLIALNFVKKITGSLPLKYATVYNYYDKDGETFRIMQLSEADINFCVSVVNETVTN